MKRRSLCGSSHDRCRCAARPEGKRRNAKTTSSMPVAHVGLAARATLDRLLAGEVQDHRDVVRAEAPQRVLVGAQLAEVQAVGVDVVDVAELARVGDLLELAHARVVLEQVADHQHAAGSRAPRDRRARRRRPTARAASRRSSACRPRARARRASACVGTGVASTTASSSGSASRSSRSAVKRACGMRAGAGARAIVLAPSQHQRSSAPGSAVEVAREVRAPVAEADDADA